MEKNRRKKQKRNVFVYHNRRKAEKNGGYPKESMCPECSRPIVENNELCEDCLKHSGTKMPKI